MVITRDQITLLEELLLGLCPGPDRQQRAAIAIQVLHAQDLETTRMLATWLLGACSGAIETVSQGDPLVYRARVKFFAGGLL